MNNEEEQLNQRSKVSETSDALLGAYVDKKMHEKDVDAINSRKGKNESTKRHTDEESDESTSKKASSLEEKEGLKDKDDKLKDKEEKGNIPKKAPKIDEASSGNPIKDKMSNLNPIVNIKKKWAMLVLKVKIIGIIAAIALSFILLLAIFSALSSGFDAIANAITNFFGISEADNSTGGLFSNEENLFDENGEELNHEELINKLNSENTCKYSKWNLVWDWLNGKQFNTPCELMRYVKYEVGDGNFDVSLLISTIFYGYDSQAYLTEYEYPEDVPDDYISSSEHYESLKRILHDNRSTLNRNTVKTIIDNSITTSTEQYFTWIISESDDGETLTGKCELTSKSSYRYNINKWKVFMRFGEKVASDYDKYANSSMSYVSSDEECRGEMSDDDLIALIKKSTDKTDINIVLDSASVKNARETLKGASATSADGYLQYADIETKTLDVFQSVNGENLDYINGFAFNNFPGFRQAFEDPAINRSYDNVFTPKEIEELIQSIISKKKDLNEVLLFEDPDSEDYFYGGVTGSSVITGANCKEYLSTDYSEMQVRLTDCYGTELGTVSFEDYIIGVANAEVSDRNDNYVMSEMLAAISYALHRHNNYTKGNLITMRSGTCDQAYCSPIKGCYVKNTPVGTCTSCNSFYIGGGQKVNPSIYTKYQALYAKAADYLVVSNGTVHNAHYVSTVQNEWFRKASAGMSFTQIIQETYKDEGAEVIRCSNEKTKVTNENSDGESTNKSGNKTTSEYNKQAPDLGVFYGYSYKDEGNNIIEINPDWKYANLTTIKPTCSDEEFSDMEFTVNTKAINNYKNAFNGVCKLLTEGVVVSGKLCKYTMDDLLDGATFIERSNGGDIDPHSYGISQDWNYSSKYIINGVEYRPYATRNLEDYMKFINAIGGEEKCQNVNYVLWKYAYKNAGFIWGGNFGRNGNSGTFDGKLFEVKYN